MIEELEVLGVPSLFKDQLEPYVHFITVEKRRRTVNNASGRRSISQNQDIIVEELKSKVDNLTEQIKVTMSLSLIKGLAILQELVPIVKRDKSKSRRT